MLAKSLPIIYNLKINTKTERNREGIAQPQMSQTGKKERPKHSPFKHSASGNGGNGFHLAGESRATEAPGHLLESPSKRMVALPMGYP